MIKLGIISFCNKNVQKYFDKYKTRFLAKSKINYYAEHPAHITFYVFHTKKKHLDQIVNEFEKLINNVPLISAQYDGWEFFEKDILTNLNTAYMKLEKNERLFELQLLIAKKLSEYSYTIVDEIFDNEFKKSYLKYGYPFIGRHWIPHVSIGSFDIEILKMKKMLKNNFKDSIGNSLNIKSIGIYEICDNDHNCLIKKELS